MLRFDQFADERMKGTVSGGQRCPVGGILGKETLSNKKQSLRPKALYWPTSSSIFSFALTQ